MSQCPLRLRAPLLAFPFSPSFVSAYSRSLTRLQLCLLCVCHRLRLSGAQIVLHISKTYFVCSMALFTFPPGYHCLLIQALACICSESLVSDAFSLHSVFVCVCMLEALSFLQVCVCVSGCLIIAISHGPLQSRNFNSPVLVWADRGSETQCVMTLSTH